MIEQYEQSFSGSENKTGTSTRVVCQRVCILYAKNLLESLSN
jgi:hypothetical protein